MEGPARPPAEVARQASAQAAAHEAVGAGGARRILFGDLHVHSTFSIDAFVFSLPVFGGEGVHPPADACDFARWCADLDFFSINDHAESLTPERWESTQRSIRECNARAGDPADPDLVAYLGFEWTQVGPTPDTHFGHKNVMFPGLDDDEVPTRPITALPDGVTARARGLWIARVMQPLTDWFGDYGHFLWFLEQLGSLPDCPQGVDVRELPADCRENAETPEALFEKLGQWGFPTLVIPHGLAWGIHAPPGARLDLQLRADRHPESQRLLEVHSGHGNSEAFRPYPGWRVAAGSEDAECPVPTPERLPCCWRAGELVRERCGDIPPGECQARVEEARQLALRAGTSPHLVLPDTRPEDWLDCDQCRDCFKPAQSLRPGMSAQYALALSDFEDPEPGGESRRFEFGFIASTDNHSARAGAGYKQVMRERMTDARGAAGPWSERWLRRYVRGAQEDPDRAQPVPARARGFRGLLDVERGGSFMYAGGLVAVHAEARDRHAIWRALERREVYGTSGPRMLLWFDVLNAPEGRAPMGSRVALVETPRFEVRAVGARVQQPGCPESARRALSPGRLEALCGGECHHPGDARQRIAAIEVVRIRPQARPDEPVEGLVEDPWRRFECEPDPAGCVVRFEDPDFVADGRDTTYYVRALQEPTPAINGDTLRTQLDAEGHAIGVTPCHGGWRTPGDEDCLADVQERAWSSPIFVDRARGAARPDGGAS